VGHKIGGCEAAQTNSNTFPGLPIIIDTVHQLQEKLGGVKAHDAAFQFVDPEFQAAADEAYVGLSCPNISLSSAWDIFIVVVDILDNN
jgi:hypothetical protein